MNLEEQISSLENELSKIQLNPELKKDPFECTNRKDAERIYNLKREYNQIRIEIDSLKRQLPKDAKRVFTGILRAEILKRDNYQCVRCGSDESLQIDHIIPWHKGGKTNYENAQVLCKKCNYNKLLMEDQNV